MRKKFFDLEALINGKCKIQGQKPNFWENFESKAVLKVLNIWEENNSQSHISWKIFLWQKHNWNLNSKYEWFFIGSDFFGGGQFKH